MSFFVGKEGWAILIIILAHGPYYFILFQLFGIMTKSRCKECGERVHFDRREYDSKVSFYQKDVEKKDKIELVNSDYSNYDRFHGTITRVEKSDFKCTDTEVGHYCPKCGVLNKKTIESKEIAL